MKAESSYAKSRSLELRIVGLFATYRTPTSLSSGRIFEADIQRLGDTLLLSNEKTVGVLGHQPFFLSFSRSSFA